jgi:hypothetical protein
MLKKKKSAVTKTKAAKKISIFKSLSRRYSTPQKVQKFLKTLDYNREKTGETVQSAQTILRTQKAHCLEASVLTAAILEEAGYPPLVLSIESKDLLCHAVFVFKTKTGWGAVAKSRFPGLHGRAPKFKNLKALVMSYYEPFVHRETAKIVGYSLVNLNDSGTDWRFSKRNLWKLEQFVVNSTHTPLPTSDRLQQKHYRRLVDHGILQKGKHWW